MDPQQIIEQAVDSRYKDELIGLSQKIWELAEVGYEEFKSAETLCQALEQHGFTVTRNLVNIPTAFKGVWGKGKPVVGILGEYDALPGLSQEAGCPVKKPEHEGCPGHGCGHNLLGTGALAGALALKEYLEATGKPGTVVYFGTPAEENLSGKTFMARDGAFDGVDFFLSWHPGPENRTATPHLNANVCRTYKFKGITSHAAAAPELGRSALDSCEIMGVGANYLREHVIMEARIQYAYLDVGGRAPNVVQDHAAVRYVVRAPYYSQVKEIVKRLDDVARGAALICGTKVSVERESGYSEYINNKVLAQAATEAFHAVGVPKWDAADFALAKKFTEAFSDSMKTKETQMLLKRYGKARLAEKLEQPLDTEIKDFDPDREELDFGSTDVGDVGFIALTYYFTAATEAFGTPGHSWYKTGQVNSPIGWKGMLTAGKVIALTAVKVMEDPALLEAAKQEFMEKNGGKYDCPVAGVEKLPKL